MKRKFDNEDLRYLNGRIDRVFKEIRKLEDLVFKWKREDSVKIDKLEKRIKWIKYFGNLENYVHGGTGKNYKI